MFVHPTLSALALLALSQPAQAFAPTDGQGIEPIRVRHYDALTQHELRQQGAWREFVQGEGQGWRARFDQLTGTPHRMWGHTELGQLGSEADVEAELRAFIERNHGLLGADNDSLELRNATWVPERDTWYVHFDRIVDGAPIYRGGLMARIKHGNLVQLGADTYPDAPVVNEVRQSMVEAIAAALDRGPSPGAAHLVEHAELLALPEVDGDRVVLRMVWAVHHETEIPRGIWITMVDAFTGEVINWHNQVRFLEGVVQGRHDDRYPAGSFATSPMPWLDVDSDAGSTTTDDSGVYELEGSSFSADLTGDLVRVSNYSGSEGSLSWGASDDAVTWTTDDADQAEIDTYVFINEAFEWGQEVAPELSYVSANIRSTVNINSACNAYYDGNVNFYSAGSGCNNTGRIADVNYHEWGHGFHYYSVYAGGGSYYDVDGSIGEGAADVVSLFQTGDPRIAPYFYTSGGAIRTADNSNRYPDDFVNNSNYVHSNGTIFSGAMYDLWLLLEDDLGEEEGKQVAEAIFSGALQNGPDVESSFDAALLADDDDGDLSNGTPHYCALVEAFGNHGLADYGSVASTASYEVAFVPPTFATPGVDIELDASIFEGTIECESAVPESARLYWRLAGEEDYEEVDVDFGDTELSATIPAQEEGAIVEYFFEVYDDEDGSIQAPGYGEFAPVTTYVGELTEIWCEDFEDDDGGFKGRKIEGPSGANDWDWDTPEGESYDPSSAASGDYVWGNDLDDDGEYREESELRLRSPDIDVSGYEDLHLVYNRWLSVEDGYYDTAHIESNEEVVWLNHESSRSRGDENHIDTQWVEHTVALPDAGEAGTVQIGWFITSDGGLELGGWNIDDVCIYGRSTDVDTEDPANPDDTDATDDVDDFEPNDLVQAGGCACSSGSTTGGAAWLTLLLPFWLGRRRRR